MYNGTVTVMTHNVPVRVFYGPRIWYKIEPYLQWQTDRKSYLMCRMVSFSKTLNDL